MSCWRNDLRSMRQRMEAILEDNIPDIPHDVTFIVGEEKVKMSCHKFPLMAASPVFQAMFSQTFPQEEEICISDVIPVGLKNLIKYAYNHILNVDVNDASATMYAAHKYDIKELFEHCAQVLQSKMGVDIVVTCYQTALLLNHTQLENDSWEFIKKNAGDLLESGQFLEFSEDNLCNFLELNEMIFKAVLKWGRKECEKEGMTTKPENLKAVLKKIIPLIRFPNMGPYEFMDTVKPSGLLTDSECCTLYEYFLLSGEKKLSMLKTLQYSSKQRDSEIEIESDDEDSDSLSQKLPSWIFKKPPSL